MEVPFFESICNECGNRFEYPAFSDFDYGKLIASFEKTSDYFVVNLLANPVVDFMGKAKDELSTSRFQQVVSGCADKALHSNITTRSACPACGSHNVGVNKNNKKFTAKLVVASYNGFLSLDEKEKSKLIASKVG